MQARELRGLTIGAALLAAITAPAAAQDFDKGKTPAQIFHSDCGVCHQSASALGKSMSEGALAGFLAVHYTENRQIAALIANYLASLRHDAAPEKRRPRRSPDRKNSANTVGRVASASADVTINVP